MNLIEEGMVIIQDTGVDVTLIKIERGKFGLLLEGENKEYFSREWQSYLPYELPPVERTLVSWYGFISRGHIVLPNGRKLGRVSLTRLNNHIQGLEEHDTEWERTEIAMRAEE